MNDYEREVLRFLLCWEPYGGPAGEDTFTRFGLEPTQLYERAGAIVTKARISATLSACDRELLQESYNVVSQHFSSPTDVGAAHRLPSPVRKGTRGFDDAGKWTLTKCVWRWTVS